MIRRILVLFLQFRAFVIEQDILTREEGIEDKERRMLSARKGLHICYEELRRVRARIATITPASTLLMQALRRSR